MTSKRIRRRLAAVALTVVVLLAVSSCFGAIGAPEPPTAEDLEIPAMNETALANLGAASGSDPAAGAAYGMVFSANIFQLLAVTYTQIALEGWDEDQQTSYTDATGAYSITWTQDGDTWSWTFEFTDGVDTLTLVIAVTAEENGWSLVVTQDGSEFLEATLSEDGSSGQVTFTADDSGEYILAEWGPSSVSGYDQNYSVGYYGAGGVLEQGVTADYTTDGASGAWTYTDHTDASGESNGSGTWG